MSASSSTLGHDKLRILLLLLFVSMLLFEAARLSGSLASYPFPLFAPPSLATALGGMIFGIGMVLTNLATLFFTGDYRSTPVSYATKAWYLSDLWQATPVELSVACMYTARISGVNRARTASSLNVWP